MSYKNLRIIERQNILCCIASKYLITETAEYIGRNKATVSRELNYPSETQKHYQQRRKKCCPKKKLENLELFQLVQKLFLQYHWSPDPISLTEKL